MVSSVLQHPGKMDTLQRLEDVQRMLELMRNHSIFSPDSASDRFLAEFLLFMVQACTNVEDMKGRCCLLVEQLPKMSTTLLKAALCQKAKLDYKEIKYKDTSISNINSAKEIFPYVGGHDMDMPLIGLKAMERAKATLEDFCRSYFMFHSLDVCKPASLFRYLPILTFVESYIYELDDLNEELLHPSKESSHSLQNNLRYAPNRSKMKCSKTGSSNQLSDFETDPFMPLRCTLKNKGLMTERIDMEFRNGVEYWALERSLCNALLKETEISAQDAMRALQLKSFDYRVLNLLLYGLSNQEVNECHWEFLSVSELLVEIADDLFDYEEDVLNNNFNILRMFVKVYGSSKAPTMLANCIFEAEEQYQRLLNQLDPSLAFEYQKRCEEAVKEGGNLSGHSLGSWSIPSVISDEVAYRLQQQC